MDFADIASEREQIDTERAIAAARTPPRSDPVPCGQCYNCEAAVAADRAFCDVDCRDDWQARRKAGRA